MLTSIMRRHPWIPLFSLLVLLPLSPQTPSLSPHLHALSTTDTPRAYLLSALSDAGIPVSPLSPSPDAPILATLSRHRPTTLTLVLPLGTPFPPALGITLLAWAETTDIPVNLEVLFVQERTEPSAPLPPPFPVTPPFHHTLSYLEGLPALDHRVLLYLDISHPASSLTLHTTASARKAPPWLLSALLRAAGPSLSIQTLPSIPAQTLSLLAPDDIPYASLLTPLYTHDLPSAVLTPAAPSTDPTPLLDFLTTLITTLPPTPPRTWENHYLAIPLNAGHLIVIHEHHYLILLLAGITAALLFGFFRFRHLRRYLSIMKRGWFMTPLLFLATGAFLLLGTILLRSIAGFHRYDAFLLHHLQASFLLKISLTVFLISTLLFLLRIFSLPLMRVTHYYTAAAILLLALDIALFGSIMLPLAIVFLWALLCATGFSVTRSRLLRLLLFLLSPLWIVYTLWWILSTPAPPSLLLTPPAAGDLLMAFLLLPFLLLLFRLDILLHRPATKVGTLLLLSLTLFGLATALLTTHLLLTPTFTEETPRPVHVVEYIDETERRITVESPAPLSGLILTYDTAWKPLPETRTFSLTTPAPPSPLLLSTREHRFLNRLRIDLTIESTLPLDACHLTLESEEGLPLLETTFPFEFDTDRKRALVVISPVPSLPLTLPLYIPHGRPITLTVRALTRSNPGAPSISSPLVKVETHTVYIRTLTLGGGP
ncbi:hypothetical protein Spith_1830 [Spirochaeta thermophila DSM 6578]|uniref:Uncharacterized protein n=2 Tax=Winmispira thermophila TaxID=154 RepID=G0GCM3_WINT7|nr:hypothetical protein Spith_1830 [Spirochaeta thermophila DSM 6578]